MKILLFVTKPYSFSILETVQNAAKQSGYSVKWFTAASAREIIPPGERLQTSQNVEDFNPHAVIVPGNVVPDFWPGFKVQLFHGLGEEKRGHYRITNFFDLYCTPGPYMTNKFEILANKHKNFLVRETGWPKLDSLQIDNKHERKIEYGFEKKDIVILYAPTFSPRYSSANDLYSEIQTLAENKPYKWLVKFHPLMAKEFVKKYNQIINKNFRIIKDENILPYMEASDLLLTDSSSVAYEFLLFDRPIITYKATTRRDKGINIINSDQLEKAIERSLKDPNEYSSNRKSYLNELHPYTDGKSAERIIETIKKVIQSKELQTLKLKKPNWLQKRQIRKMVS